MAEYSFKYFFNKCHLLQFLFSSTKIPFWLSSIRLLSIISLSVFLLKKDDVDNIFEDISL